MSNSRIESIQCVFDTRLDTLAHLLRRAEETFAGSASFLQLRLAPDMAPFGTQIAFTCNQPRNFVLWSQKRPAANLDPAVETIQQAHAYIERTKEQLLSSSADDARLATTTRVDLGPDIYAEMSGEDYVHEFLLPNFYFHLVTAYDILRMAGVAIGKADYMLHLMPLVKRGPASQ
ncbi:MAG: DUF1993 domain-containing protein [Gammaproteobacteria bacterium]|nr:DUF1993 domain-containing protein [Gammaproteobacteria bacterium]